MTIANYVRQIINAAEIVGESLNALIVEERIYAAHSAEIAAEVDALARQRIRNMAQSQLSARTRTEQQVLPGFDLPQFLSRLADGPRTETFVPVSVATVGDGWGHLNLRLGKINDATRAVAPMRRTMRRIPADTPHSTLLLKAIAP